jgi:hypothetical protein
LRRPNHIAALILLLRTTPYLFQASRSCQVLASLGFAVFIGLCSLPFGAIAAESPSESRHRFQAAVGLLQVDVPVAATSGTVLPSGPGSEFPGLYTPDSVDLTGGRFAYEYQAPKLTFMASWSRYTGAQTASASVASGAADTGLLFTRGRPSSYLPGPAGLASTANVSVDYGRLGFGVKWLQASSWLNERTRLMPSVRFAWTQYNYIISSTDVFDQLIVPQEQYSDSRTQQMQQDLFELRLGARLERAFGSLSQFSVYGDAGFDVYLLKAYLSSFEHLTLAGSKQFRWSGDGERDIFFGADIGLGVGWQITPGWRTSFSANYSPWVPTAVIVNPTQVAFESGTYVDSEKQRQVLFLLGLEYGFR